MQEGWINAQIRERKQENKIGKVINNAMELVKSPVRLKEIIIRLATYVLLFDIAFVFLFPFL